MARITIAGVVREVVLTRNADGYVVTVEGRPYDVRDVVRAADGICFSVAHNVHYVPVSPVADGIQLTLEARTFFAQREVVDADRPAGGVSGGDGRLEAPMPGTIVSVAVTKGDRVRANQPLVVLESMKMHNEITAPFDGVVESVGCRAGEQVSFGQTLVVVTRETS